MLSLTDILGSDTSGGSPTPPTAPPFPFPLPPPPPADLGAAPPPADFLTGGLESVVSGFDAAAALGSFLVAD